MLGRLLMATACAYCSLGSCEFKPQRSAPQDATVADDPVKSTRDCRTPHMVRQNRIVHSSTDETALYLGIKKQIGDTTPVMWWGVIP